MTIIRSYRLFGNFTFEAEDGGPSLALGAGIIDVFHAQRDGNKRFLAFLRWTKIADSIHDAAKDPERVPDTNHNPYIPGYDLRKNLVNTKAGKSVAFWVDKPSGKKCHDLSFTGAVGIETIPKDHSAPRRYLCNDFANDPSGLAVVSELTNNKIAIIVRLPTPLPLKQRGEDLHTVALKLKHITDYGSSISNDRVFKPDSFVTGLKGDYSPQTHSSNFRLDDFGVRSSGAKPYGYALKYKDSDGNLIPVATDSLFKALGFSIRPAPTTDANNHNVEFRSTVTDEGFRFSAICRRVVETKGKGLDLSRQLGAEVARDEKILTETEMKIDVSDIDLLKLMIDPENKSNSEEDRLKPEFEVRLKWDEWFRTPDDFDLESLKGGGLIDALRIMEKTREGLIQTRSQPHSLIPDIDLPEKGSEKKRLALAAYFKPEGSFSPKGGINLTQKNHALPTGITIPPHEKGGRINWAWEELAPKLSVKASFNSFQTAPPTDAKFDLQLVHDPSIPKGLEDVAVSFRIEDSYKDSNPAPPRLKGQLGSLELTGTGRRLLAENSEPDVSFLRMRRRARTTQPTKGEPHLDVELNLLITLNRVLPVTVDVPHGDRITRQTALLVDERRQNAGSDEQIRFIMQVTERVRDDQDHLLSVRLTENAIGSADRAVYTVLEQEPFSVFRFSRLPLSQSGDARNADVAEWDSDQRTWLFKKTSELYRFTYPPAVTTDAADKPGQMEIHDAPASKKGETTPPVPPNPSPPANPADPSWRYAVDMRYSPATDLWIKPTDLSRNYVQPEFNARALFRGKGDFGPGVSLAALRGELAYPMTFGLQVPPPNTAVPGPRIAEISALTGNMVSVETTIATDETKDVLNRWARVRKAARRRTERLEAFEIDARRANPFVPARFDKGLNFALRNTGLISPPVPLTAVELADHKKDKPSGPRLSDHGLAGGVVWPLESKAWLLKLLENPVALGGTIEGFAISPHGGSGDQVVEFLSGAVKIITETRNGMLQKLRVEITGRVSVFWHRAKHVVIYNRTTAPSAQFTPSDPDNAKSRSERPVLRKVEEFVDILEPIRRYPDFPRDSATGPGMLREVRFNSRIIHVNSDWGKDIVVDERNVGWEIPLWNIGESKARPQVYPFPDVAFVTSGEGAEEMPLCVQECLDVDNLYFWTDAQTEPPADGRVDTDRWPARAGQDFSAVFPAGVVAKVVDEVHRERTVDAGKKEKDLPRRPPAPRMLPGLRRFTWRLAPGARKSVLNEGYGDKPIFGGVESITFMRNQSGASSMQMGYIGSEALSSDNLKSLLQTRENPVNIVLPGSAYLNRPSATPPGWEDLKKAISDLPKGPAQGQTLLNELKKKNPEALAKDAFKHFGGHNLVGKVANAKIEIENLITLVEGVDCAAMAADYQARLSSKRLLISQQIESAMALFRAEINAIRVAQNTDVPAYIDVIKMAEAALAKRTGSIIDKGRAEVGDLVRSIEKTREVVRDWHEDAEAAFDGARKRLDEWSAQYDRDKPWSATRLRNARQAMNDQINGAHREAQAAVEEVRQRLAGETDQMARNLTFQVNRALKGGLDATAAGRQDNNQLEVAYKQVRTRVNGAERQLIDARKKFNDDKLAAKLTGFEDRLRNKGKTKKADLVKDIRDRLLNVIDSVDGRIEQIRILKGRFVEYSDKKFDETVNKIGRTLDNVDRKSIEVGRSLTRQVALIHREIDLIAQGLDSDLQKELDKFRTSLIDSAYGYFTGFQVTAVSPVGQLFDDMVAESRTELTLVLHNVERIADDGLARCDGFLESVQEQIITQANNLADSLNKALVDDILKPSIRAVLNPLKSLFDNPTPKKWIEKIIPELEAASLNVSVTAIELLDRTEGELASVVMAAKTACLELNDAGNSIWKHTGQGVLDELENQVNTEEIQDLWEDAKEWAEKYRDGTATLNELKDKINAFDRSISNLVNQVGDGEELARAYADRALANLNNLGKGGISSAPNNALKLYAAVTQAPEIAELKANMDRIQTTFDEVEKVVKSSAAKAMFDQLGDALRALGIDLPFNELGDEFKLDTDALRGFDGGDIMKWFGGINLDAIKPDLGSAEDLGKYVKLTHDFDKKAVRAWVQMDVTAPVPGRRALFSLGPFTLYFRDTIFDGFVRMEASKDTNAVEATDKATIATNIEAVVGGQVMVTLQDVALTYTGETGLNIEFDAKKIKLNPTFKFIQDTLGSIFGDEFGGMQFIKQNGIPIGLEHEFSMPPMSLMYGTSGVQNLAISNRFSLIAYPDFVLSNRFNLSRQDLPFLFSIFIIGGTGYIQVDTEYEPLKNRLMVAVEAGAGGSASLAFAFGPVAGGVFISISVTLRYQKRIGYDDGNGGTGLTVSLVVVVAGNVSLWGMVSIYLGLTLAISYHDSGQMDGRGGLSVEVKISRWFKLKYSTQVTYKLRDGQSTTTRTSNTELGGKYRDILKKAEALDKARKSL